MHEVKDGARILQFSGKKLGESSSWRTGSNRWIEFALYRTDKGSYVMSRVGVSLVFHGASCPLVERYGLIDKSITELKRDATPCEECQPTWNVPVVFPEKYRYWAMVTEDPRAILAALYKPDSGGTKYLTKVAERLLEDAAENDAGIDSIYRIEMIP